MGDTRRWHDMPMTWGNGVRLWLVIVVVDALANGDMLPALIRGMSQ